MIASPSNPTENASSPTPTAAAANVMTPISRTCSPFSTVTEAAMIFRDENTDMVPIVDGGKLVGVIVDRDVALAVPDVPDLGQQPVTSVMAGNVPTVAADAGLEEVAQALAETNARWALVLDAEGSLVGYIPREELIRRAPIEAALVPASDHAPPEPEVAQS